MGFISRGFKGRRRDNVSTSRLPPGQYVVNDFPVLSAGPTPRVALDQWTFSIEGEIDEPKRWSWQEFLALPSETVTQDIHCVTKWSKFETTWKGVSVDCRSRM
jgi:DMSO/TMAO reductase YedYZ molybdopterin-dependent catalytic subunit